MVLFLQSIRLCQDRVLLVTSAYRGLASLAKASGEPGGRGVGARKRGQTTSHVCQLPTNQTKVKTGKSTCCPIIQMLPWRLFTGCICITVSCLPRHQHTLSVQVLGGGVLKPRGKKGPSAQDPRDSLGKNLGFTAYWFCWVTPWSRLPLDPRRINHVAAGSLVTQVPSAPPADGVEEVGLQSRWTTHADATAKPRPRWAPGCRPQGTSRGICRQSILGSQQARDPVPG